MSIVYKICIPNTFHDVFDYHGHELKMSVGARVWVPFRNQTRLGVVISAGAAENSRVSIKNILSVVDEQPFISAQMLRLYQWVSRYYQAPLSEVIALALPKKYRLGEQVAPWVCAHYTLSMPLENARERIPVRAKRQRALLEFVAGQPPRFSKAALVRAGFKPAQWQALLERGVLSEALPLNDMPHEASASAPLPLNEEQAQAVKIICAQLSQHQGYLLQGVTGSGKTEVYLHVIAEVLKAGKQILILVPEIGLTPQLLARFAERFPIEMVVIHSHLSDKERQIAWHRACSNDVKLVIGTRSAIFTPMPALGLIVLDEEHDPSFKQMEGVRYSARDTALMRAYWDHIPVILGTATPSFETLHNAMQGKYQFLQLTQKALNNAPLHYQILDIRNQRLHHGLAEPALNAIRTHLHQGNQVLVFINRRGFSPVLLCHQCGWMADCRACDSHATLHRRIEKMICHHCGLMHPIPTECPTCRARELLPIGAGTQRVHEFLTLKFPAHTVLRVDRDETRNKEQWEAHLARIHSREVQLIVGTQMLAKGHHFPQLTLVVVLDADNGFYNQDFRALERLGQLLIQVAGRAGRAQWPGQVLIQTHLPHHPALKRLLHEGYPAFAHALLKPREQAGLPPFHYLALIRAQGKQVAEVLQFLHHVKKQLPEHLAVLGPAPAPLARKANQHRMQLLVKSVTRKNLQSALTELRSWLTMNKLANGIRWSVDVDPIDLS